MSSAAHDESFGDPRWRYRSRGPWGGWGGGCWGWGQHASWNGQSGTAASWGPPWGAGNPYWAPHFIPKPVLILLTILGFIFWWPIGLVLLAVMFLRRHAFCGYHGYGWRQGAASGPGPGRKTWFGGQPPSSGNHAFDEYRAETLRRLEEEQKEFAEFLERLRFAKDKAEFDQFVNERRNRPNPPPPSEPPANPAS